MMTHHCDKCGAQPGSACRTPSGRQILTHKGRLREETRERLMNRVAGAVCLVNQTQYRYAERKMTAFLGIFHPDLPRDRALELIRSQEEPRRLV